MSGGDYRHTCAKSKPQQCEFRRDGGVVIFPTMTLRHRLLAARLAGLRDVIVGALTRPQAGVADFYRELGHLFGVALSPHNRWAGAKALRDTWLAHIDAAVFRPVLLVDEAQDVRLDVLNELRLLASADLDARVILTVVLAGDRRLQDRLRARDLLPLDSRLRVKLLLDAAARDELAPSSDLDVLVELAGPARFSAYMDLKFYLEDLLGRPVDLVTGKALRNELRPYVEKELIRVA